MLTRALVKDTKKKSINETFLTFYELITQFSMQ